jgi:immunity protein 27 of polymorphic toxin system
MSDPVKLADDETELVGQWLVKGPKITADAICARIEGLISGHLVSLGADESCWDALYRDPDTGQLWELSWPQSSLHGGGPPRLRLVLADDVRPKYGQVTDG